MPFSPDGLKIYKTGALRCQAEKGRNDEQGYEQEQTGKASRRVSKHT